MKRLASRSVLAVLEEERLWLVCCSTGKCLSQFCVSGPPEQRSGCCLGLNLLSRCHSFHDGAWRRCCTHGACRAVFQRCSSLFARSCGQLSSNLRLIAVMYSQCVAAVAGRGVAVCQRCCQSFHAMGRLGAKQCKRGQQKHVKGPAAWRLERVQNGARWSRERGVLHSVVSRELWPHRAEP